MATEYKYLNFNVKHEHISIKSADYQRAKLEAGMDWPLLFTMAKNNDKIWSAKIQLFQLWCLKPAWNSSDSTLM
jgi:hypothetical protein